MIGRLRWVVLFALGAGFAACTSSDTDDLEERLDAVEAQLAAGESSDVATALQNVAIVSAANEIGAAGLHGVDESVNDNGEIPEGAAGPINRAILAMQVTDWPDDLQGDADTLLDVLHELVEALGDGNVEAAGPVAADAHELGHEFADAAAQHVLASLGIEPEGDEHEEASETPAVGETPAEEHEEGG